MPQDYYFPNMVYMKNISAVLSELRGTIYENWEKVNSFVVHILGVFAIHIHSTTS